MLTASGKAKSSGRVWKWWDKRIGEMHRAAGTIDIVDVALDQLGQLGLAETCQKRLLCWRQPHLLGFLVIRALDGEGVQIGNPANPNLHDDTVDIAHWRLILRRFAKHVAQHRHLRQPWRIRRRCEDLRSPVAPFGGAAVALLLRLAGRLLLPRGLERGGERARTDIGAACYQMLEPLDFVLPQVGASTSRMKVSTISSFEARANAARTAG